MAVASVAILWGGWVGAPIVGLWAAVWVAGLACTAVGALVDELERRRRREHGKRWEDGERWEHGDRPPDEDGRARIVMLSGFGYLTVGMLAGWFHPALGAATLALALADFVAGHHVARTLRSSAGPLR